MSMKNLFSNLFTLLCGPRLLNYLLPILIIYLIIGTVAQKYIGLYEATKIFFSQPVLWLGFIPLPGLPVIMALIFVNLLFKLVFKSPWVIKNSGIIITHIGALLLLLGGLFTALYSHEGFVDLAEGGRSAFATDYHKREFILINDQQEVIFKKNHNDLKAGDKVKLEKAPLTIEIIEHCRNCRIEKRTNADETYISMAQHMSLKPDKLKHMNEENFSGLTFRLKGSENDGVYVVLENVPKLPQVIINKKQYSFMLRKEVRPLPFEIELIDFKRENYPGTDMAKSYSSHVRIHDDGKVWESLISMNEPLRYEGYTLFQSSFVRTPEGDMSVLAVVWNIGRSFPYISAITMCIGLLIHLFVRKKSAKSNANLKGNGIGATKILLFLLPLLTLFASPASAQSLDIDDFYKLPIMHDGRIKPMNSFAHIIRKELSQNEKGAEEWLLEVLFNPAASENAPAIKITNPNLLNMLGLKRTSSKLYSYKQVTSALSAKQDVILSIVDTPEESWSSQERDLILLQKKTVKLGDLLSSMSLYLTLAVELPENVPQSLKGYSARTLTYLETHKFKERLNDELKALILRKGDDPENYDVGEKAMAYLSFSIANLQMAGSRSNILNVIPATQKGESWFSPWALVLQGKGTPANKRIFELWGELAKSYSEGRADDWNKALADLSAETHSLSDDYLRATALNYEYLYSKYEPMKLSAYFYIAAILVLLLMRLKKKRFNSALLKSVCTLLSVGVFIHFISICARMYVLERPPVSTLYESVIFVGLAAVLYSLCVYLKNKDLLWLYIAAFGGVFFHILGFSHDKDGDSMLMLSAVLNTNFWLATHVIIITLAYAFCTLCSALAHYSLLKSGITREEDKNLKSSIHGLALLSLLFAIVGTVLGGIWADQSWGRFWGWDPKENGAMLICLWLIWVLHGRVSGQMKGPVVMALLAYLSVILALSWFGVNLLSVGLHAYGFTDSAAWMLGLFIAFETLLITALLYLLKMKRRENA